MSAIGVASVNAGKLNTAAELVEQVIATLDRRVETCTCCNLNKALNWPEEQLARELDAIVKKLADRSNTMRQAHREAVKALGR
jgi:uncharacterized sporulation protein YeaH/YhbH (DUF444 family)